jgi:hypothetical protein
MKTWPKSGVKLIYFLMEPLEQSRAALGSLRIYWVLEVTGYKWEALYLQGERHGYFSGLFWHLHVT